MGGTASRQVDTAATRDDSFEREAVKSLQQLCSTFTTTCTHPGCDESFMSDSAQVLARWSAGAQQIPPTTQLCGMECKKGHRTCVGCGKSSMINPNQDVFTPLGVVNHCCDSGRLFTIFFLLSRFDDAHLRWAGQHREKAVGDARSEKFATKQKKAFGKKALVPGVGYGASGAMEFYGSEAEMIAFESGMNPYYPRRRVDSRQGEREEEQVEKDFLMSNTVKLLSACLLDSSCDASSELNMFRLSILIDKVTEMIRNDSIEDITQRFDVYNAITAFLEKIVRHETLVQLLLEKRRISNDHPGIKALGSRNSVYRFQDTSSSGPFSACYGNTLVQAKTFLDMTQKTKSKFETPPTAFLSTETVRLLSNMVTCLESLEKFIQKEYIVAQEEPERDGVWYGFANENRLTFTNEVLSYHRFENDFKPIFSSNRGRLNTISKEIATMKTSLPPGIFLKVADSRSDVMKVLIVGSEGSPYAGGLFIFDIFLDENYPQSPPKMAFVMKGNNDDGESFNPNLHLGAGTVCLSLLNTWPGHETEAWQPGKSTILSVLVSVQAMILGAPLPWENEPGYEGSGPTLKVLSHKSRVQSRTVRFAMITWVENKFQAETMEHIWKEISQAYWKHNGTKVLGYVKTWAKETPGLLCFGMTPYWGRLGLLMTGTSESTTCNLVERLSNALQIEYDPAEFESQMRSALAQTKRKSNSSATGGIAKKANVGSQTIGSMFNAANKWIYTGLKSQKEVKKACKDFGVGFKGSIAASVERLEIYVNENLDVVNEKHVKAWGKTLAGSVAAPEHPQALTADPQTQKDGPSSFMTGPVPAHPFGKMISLNGTQSSWPTIAPGSAGYYAASSSLFGPSSSTTKMLTMSEYAPTPASTPAKLSNQAQILDQLGYADEMDYNMDDSGVDEEESGIE